MANTHYLIMSIFLTFLISLLDTSIHVLNMKVIVISKLGKDFRLRPIEIVVVIMVECPQLRVAFRIILMKCAAVVIFGMLKKFRRSIHESIIVVSSHSTSFP
jgi:hypothetical protein